MALVRGAGTKIALNVVRTRVTVLVFNLTIISVMLSVLGGRAEGGDQGFLAHLSSFVALFTGFCLTLLGLFWLLSSQEWDEEGLSRLEPFTLGAMTTYLALSQTVTAFMHEYLRRINSAIEAVRPGSAETGSLVPPDVLGGTGQPVLLLLGSAIWILTTYVGPLKTGIKGAVCGGRGWVFAAYYAGIQIPIYWVYAEVWRLQYLPADQPTNLLGEFAVQFAQPLLWFR
jgi:hypothetical protein